MNKYEKCSESLMRLGDTIIAEKKRRKAIILRSAALGLGAASIIGIGICTNALRPPKKPVSESSGIIVETTAVTSAETTAKYTSQTEKSTSKTAEASKVSTATTVTQQYFAETSKTSSAITAAQQHFAETSKASAVTTAAQQSTTHTSTADVTTVTRSGDKPATTQTTLVSSKTSSAHTTVNTQTNTTNTVTTQITTTERSKDMKKIISALTAAAMLTPIAANNTYAADITDYKDPAEKYATNPYIYDEPANVINPAEQELFDKIDQGLIDIDIDRNGELDMRDAALLRTYEEWKYDKEHIYVDSFEFKAPSEESMEFLETREDIRNKEFFKKSRYYQDKGDLEIASLDSLLLIRYHLTHTLKPEYFREDYYMDTIGYPYLVVHANSFNIEKLKQYPEIYEQYNNKKALIGYAFETIRIQSGYLTNIIRMRFCTDLDPLYDLNEDGVFDLHDVQDCVICGAHNYCMLDAINRSASEEILPYNSNFAYADNISENVYNNYVKLCETNMKYRDVYSIYFRGIYWQDLMEIYFSRNDFKLIYTTPEYFTDNRPGCENMSIPDNVTIYKDIEKWGAAKGLINKKIKTSFDDTVYYEFYEKWSADVDNGDADMPDIDGNEILDKEDFDILQDYTLEIFGNIPAENSSLPSVIRNYLDNDFDLNGNGLSGDLYDIVAAQAYILSHTPQDIPVPYSSISEIAGTQIASIMKSAVTLKGDANCDKKVTLADAVTVLQYIGNRDRYNLSEQGKINADVDESEGITLNDARIIMEMDSEGKI